MKINNFRKSQEVASGAARAAGAAHSDLVSLLNYAADSVNGLLHDATSETVATAEQRIKDRQALVRGYRVVVNRIASILWGVQGGHTLVVAPDSEDGPKIESTEITALFGAGLITRDEARAMLSKTLGLGNELEALGR